MSVHYAEEARENRPWCGTQGKRQLVVTTVREDVTCARCRLYLRLDGEVDVAEFIAARLDEDQAWAEKVLAEKARLGWKSEDDAWDMLGPSGIAEWSAMRAAERMLREAAAKHAILARLQESPDIGGTLARQIRSDLAAVWSDHQDYDPAWAAQ